MRVIIEAHGIKKFGGGRSATMNLLERLIPMAEGDDFILILESFEPTLDYPHVRQMVVPLRNRFVIRLWLQANLPLLARRQQADLIHFAKNLTVLGTGTKTIVTLYDLTLLQYPDGFSTTDLWYWRYLQPHLLRRVDKIVAISHNTARDLERLYGLGQERVRVIYPPAHPRFRPLEAAEVARIRSQYGLPAQTIMHIGSFGPKKNLDTLVRAFARVADSFAGSLVFVGGPYRPGYDLPLKRLIAELGLPERVIFTGIAPAEDLPGLINAATLMVFPSLHEGFGLVAVEAMACGAPLIVSPGGALQEVVGDEGLIMPDPRDSEQLAQMMGELCRDEERRRALSDYGLTRAKIFAPETIARQTLNLYQEVRDG